jgi:hypothetical protein
MQREELRASESGNGLRLSKEAPAPSDANRNGQKPIIAGMQSSFSPNCLQNKGFRDVTANDVIRIMPVMQKATD